MGNETGAEPLQIPCDVPLKVIANEVVMVKSGCKSTHSVKDECQSLSRMVPSNSGLSWTKGGGGPDNKSP